MRFVLQFLMLGLCLASFSNIALSQSSASQTEGKQTKETGTVPASNATNADEVLRLLREQKEEIEQLRKSLIEQANVIEDLRKRVDQTNQVNNVPVSGNPNAVSIREAVLKTADIQAPIQDSPVQAGEKKDTDARLGRIEEQVTKTNEAVSKQLGSLSFSGDLRLRYESTFGLINTDPNSTNAAILGNELSSRHRARFRARFAIRGKINNQLDWGLRFATGSYSEAISTNQSMTDFYNRKPFGLDQAFVTYRPKQLPGLRLQGGKFEAPWVGTEMTFDSDLQYEGINQSYSWDAKEGLVKNVTLTAWQLPFLERNSVFIRNNEIQAEREGRDLAIYGGQLRTRLDFTPKSALTLSIADHYFSGTHLITPSRYFGSNSPAGIARDLLVSGNGNLGLSVATNNSINRDGTFSSGFNLVDMLARLDFTQSKRFPVALLFNFVTNTQVHDVVTGSGATARVLPNNENRAYWAELQVGKSKEQGDWLFDYVFTRIEKDAVFTGLNYSDIGFQSDVRAHRLNVAYTVDPRVVLSLTGIFSQRANGIRGPFDITPSGSLNPYTRRLQLDTIFRF
jgi:hypothetical protein